MRLIIALTLLLVSPLGLTADISKVLAKDGALVQSPLNMSDLMPTDKLITGETKSGYISLNMIPKSSRAQEADTLNPVMDGRQNLPEISFNWVISKFGEVIPYKRHLVTTQNPKWDYILGAGKIWRDTYSKKQMISMPFALVEKNENCVHNGALVIDLAVDSNSRFYYQISSETCAYFKADFWGIGQAQVTLKDDLRSADIVTAYQLEKSRRLPTQPIEKLLENFPNMQIDKLGLKGTIPEKDMTGFGILLDNIHYRSACFTRAGPYPFCHQLVIPSYSTAKSLFAAVSMFYLQQQYGDVLQQRVKDWIPQCDNNKWQGVTFNDLLNMTTGNYSSTASSADESNPKKLTFFNAKTNKARVDFACNHYPHQELPGKTFVYHTSDTYLLGAGMTAYLKDKLGNSADVFTDILYKQIFKPLGLSQITAKTRRTQDAERQPYVGYGLFFNRDDLLRLAQFLQQQSRSVSSSVILSQTLLREALQQIDSETIATQHSNIRYKNGFWAKKIDKTLGCEQKSWAAFSSGFGGITLAYLNHQNAYYYISDGHQYNWSGAAKQLINHGLLCSKTAIPTSTLEH